MTMARRPAATGEAIRPPVCARRVLVLAGAFVVVVVADERSAGMVASVRREIVVLVVPLGVVVAVDARVVVPVVPPVDADVVLVVAGLELLVVVGRHVGLVMMLESRVTAPLRARRRPCTDALVVAVMEVRARIVPTKCVPVPRVAELPTW
jgi:hypothetical protein